MTDIYFLGRGDWFLKTDNGIRPVTSKIIPISDWNPEKLESDIDDISYTNTALRHCSEFSAVFKLTPDDEKAYLISKSKKILKKRIIKLLPSSQPGSSFLDHVEKGLLSINDIDNCYFVIQTSKKYSQEEPAKDVKFKIKILKKDICGNSNTKMPSEIEAKPKEKIQKEPNKVTTGKRKIFKGKPKGDNELTLLAVDYINSIGLKIGDEQTVEPGIAWANVKSSDYKNRENLIKKNLEDNDLVILNSGRRVRGVEFIRRYKELFENSL